MLALIGAALLAYLPGVDVPSDSRGAVSAETPNVPAEIPEQVIEAAPLETEEEEVRSQPAPPEPEEAEPSDPVADIEEEEAAPSPPEEPDTDTAFEIEEEEEGPASDEREAIVPSPESAPLPSPPRPT